MNISEFYPTPIDLAHKILNMADFEYIETILEPSAGKGNILNALKGRLGKDKFNRLDIDAIEIDENLRFILKGHSYRIVHDDFLSFETQKRYDLIIMNPPFSNGDRHLLKAIEMQKSGGQIVCILNAETLSNAFSNVRKDLARKLEELDAKIEYISNAFSSAERKTDVEIALISLNIPHAERKSIIINHLKKEEHYRIKEVDETQYVAHGDFFKALVERYQMDIKAGVHLINEYISLKPILIQSYEQNLSRLPILRLLISKDDYYSSNADCKLANEFIKKTRYRYWEALFQSKKFSEVFTTNLRYAFQEKLNDLSEYDFSMYNIKQLQLDMNKMMIQSVEDTIISLFDKWSSSYWNESSKNIHYYNGWKTNKSWYIDKRVIFGLDAFDDWSGKYQPTWYKVKESLGDIEKVFNYLDCGLTEHIDLNAVLEEAKDSGETRKLVTKYFLVTFYKKGTCHIEFRDLELLKKFNILGSQRKGWLPPGYGKKQYKDMTTEEKAVIDEFEGKKEYEKTLKNLDYYIYGPSDILMIGNAG